MYEFIVNSKNCVVGKSNSVAVVLGWLPLERFTKNVSAYDYAVAGNLFSPKLGVSYLVRNLLYNPQITHLVVCSFTKEDEITQSSQVLINLWKKNILFSELDRQKPTIPNEIVSNLIDSIELHLPINFEDLETMLFSLSLLESPITRIKQLFPLMTQQFKKVFPSRLESHNLQANSIYSGHKKVLKLLRQNGKISNNIQELLNVSITVQDNINRTDELLKDASTELKAYVYNFLNGTNSKDNYGYGDRLLHHFGFNQIETVLDKLDIKPQSLACNMVLWDSQDLIKGNSPCLNTIWVRLVDEKLYLFAVFRSNDMYRAWISNVTALKALQIVMADKLKVMVGSLTTVSLSCHIYTENFTEIDNLIEQINFDKYIYSDVGNFIITIVNNIQVLQTDNDNNVIYTYSGKSANSILQQILKLNPTIESDHSGYLGIELMKAEMCLYVNKNYQQDKIIKW